MLHDVETEAHRGAETWPRSHSQGLCEGKNPGLPPRRQSPGPFFGIARSPQGWVSEREKQPLWALGLLSRWMWPGSVAPPDLDAHGTRLPSLLCASSSSEPSLAMGC